MTTTVFAYVDNSNVWIEGRRASAVVKGLASSIQEAMSAGIVDPDWTYDFGRLYEIACPADAKIGRSFLVGSRPPQNDSVWERARSEGFEVEVFDRNTANKEKQVDTRLTTVLLTDAFEHMQARVPDALAVLVAGDGDYVPPVRALQARGIKVRVVFWAHATSRELRDAADEFIALDASFDYLTLGE